MRHTLTHSNLLTLETTGVNRLYQKCNWISFNLIIMFFFVQCTGCVRLGVGTQERSVNCQYANGSIVVKEECPNDNRPSTRTECLNEDCLPIWVPGPWLPVRIFNCGHGYGHRFHWS